MDNLLKDRKDLVKFRDNRLRFIVSSRRITPDVSVMDYLKVHYIYIKPSQIDHVFGSVQMNSRLWGGRSYQVYHSLTKKHVQELYDNGIGVSLNITNHFFDAETYEASLPLLEAYHRKGNTLIITNDELAACVRKDFPQYQLKCSIIKNITSIRRIEKAFELYDYITLPMDLNDDDDLLEKISEKNRIILFANANCAYKCPARICYKGFSQKNRGEQPTSFCSRTKIPRLDQGVVYFDVEKLADMGFRNFKLVPLFYEQADHATKFLSWRKRANKAYYRKPDMSISSYPKCGRTWLRFILGNYFNRLYDLGERLDLNSIFGLLPNDTDDDVRGIGSFRYFQKTEVPFIVFTHKKVDEDLFRGKRIFILRSIADTLVSDYFQQTEHLKTYQGTIKTFIRDESRGLPKICRFYNEWSDSINREDTHVISYEMLHKNPQKTVQDLLQFIEVKVNKKFLLESIDASTFDKMQIIEKQHGMPDIEYDRNNSNALRVRKGKVGAAADYLDADDLEFVHSYINENLEKDMKHWWLPWLPKSCRKYEPC